MRIMIGCFSFLCVFSLVFGEYFFFLRLLKGKLREEDYWKRDKDLFLDAEIILNLFCSHEFLEF